MVAGLRGKVEAAANAGGSLKSLCEFQKLPLADASLRVAAAACAACMCVCVMSIYICMYVCACVCVSALGKCCSFVALLVLQFIFYRLPAL